VELVNTLTIIGLGAGDFDQLQMGVYKKLKAAKKIIRSDSRSSCFRGAS